MEKVMKIVECSYQSHAPPILDILHAAIVNSTALYDYVPRPPESMIGWFKAKEERGFPIIGAVSDRDELLGFASYGPFRAWPAYKYTIEHGIYVHKGHRREG